jgi:hypothetical protein
MNRFTHRLSLRFVTLVVALTTFVSSPAWSDDWDQQAATQIAEELPQATEKLYTALYSQGSPAGGGFGGGGDSYHQFKDNVRLMHSESMHLVGELNKGKGQAETKHAYQRIKELNDDAKEYAGQQFSENPVTSEFATVERLLEQLASFYGK